MLQIIGDLLQDEAAKQAVEQYIADRASRGLRALGVAQSHDQGATWELVGLISLLDPPRADSAETIKHAQALGVEVSNQKQIVWQEPCLLTQLNVEGLLTASWMELLAWCPMSGLSCKH